jgi:hypothetical protein
VTTPVRLNKVIFTSIVVSVAVGEKSVGADEVDEIVAIVEVV